MIGNAGKKIQNIVDLAEDLYEKVNQLREQIAALSETLDDTHERVSRVETEQETQRALLEALAEEQDVDVDEVVASVEADEPSTEGTEPAAEESSADETEAATEEPAAADQQ